VSIIFYHHIYIGGNNDIHMVYVCVICMYLYE